MTRHNTYSYPLTHQTPLWSVALKRPFVDTEQPAQLYESRALRKRARTSPSNQAHSDSDHNSGAMSPESTSEASALNSNADANMRDQDSSVSSAPPHGTMDDPNSSMESSDDSASSTAGEDEDDDDQDGDLSATDPIVTLGGPKKPQFDAGVLSGASDLASRLKAFLPQMQQANSELAERGAGMNMEDVDDGEEHIEMSLGLGVLEQKKAEDLNDLLKKKSQTCSADEQDSESDGEKQASEDEPDVLDRLMNMEREVAKAGQPGIEEVESRPNGHTATAKALSAEHRAQLALRQSGSSRSS